MSEKTVAVITGSRAEFGLMRPVLERIKADSWLRLKLYATGMHIEERFGRTVTEIEDAEFEIAKRVDIFLQDDSPRGVARSAALSMMGFADVFAADRPDILLVTGSRFEIFAAVAAACVHGIPVGHIHGGELTGGAMDSAFRHSITKMSHLHFAVTEQYRKRIIQMGEQPDRVFNTGSPSVDAAACTKLLTKDNLSAELGIKFGKRNLLVTYHPVVPDSLLPAAQFAEILKALVKTDAYLIFTYANADTGGAVINRMIEDFVKDHPERSLAVKSFGHQRYLSVLNICDGIVGNSSSGIVEAGIFKKGSVNIGMRQKGRVCGTNVIDCGDSADEILEAVLMLFSEGFENSLNGSVSPYGDGHSAERITDIIKNADLTDICKKSFYDMEM